MKKLPIGIQSFEQIMKEEYIYVDKTSCIHNLIENGKYYFLSRPRRFGKSLLISTLRCLFEGKKKLFNGLWIENRWEWKKHPVIVIDFNGITMDTQENLYASLGNSLDETGKQYSVKLEKQLLKEKFKELILMLKRETGEDVVILIDEYDKPIIEHIGRGKERLKTAKANRDILKGFYGAIKGADVADVIRFVLLTGVTKFSKVSIFSELNNLADITMDGRYCTMLGVTGEEVKKYFGDHINSVAVAQEISRENVLGKLKSYYNGYRFSEENKKVYNPFSILRCFSERRFKNYWFETGTPTFLVNLIKENNYYMPDIEKLELVEDDFSTYDIENLKIEALLFQTGYITIKGIDEPLYILGYPNDEVKISFTGVLFESFSALNSRERTKGIKAARALMDGRIEEFIEGIKGIYSEIAYSLHPKNKQQKENYYHTIFYLTLSMSGIDVRNEVLTSTGRIDLAIEFADRIYIMEFKCNQSSKDAIEQIKEKKYHEKYLHTGKEINLIGINFSTKKRNIDSWEVKKV